MYNTTVHSYYTSYVHTMSCNHTGCMMHDLRNMYKTYSTYVRYSEYLLIRFQRIWWINEFGGLTGYLLVLRNCGGL